MNPCRRPLPRRGAASSQEPQPGAPLLPFLSSVTADPRSEGGGPGESRTSPFPSWEQVASARGPTRGRATPCRLPGPSRWSGAGDGCGTHLSWQRTLTLLPAVLRADPPTLAPGSQGGPPTRSSGSVPRTAPVPTVSYCPNLPWVSVANNSAQTRGPTNHTPAFSFGKADLVPCREDQPLKFFLSVAVGHSAGTRMDPAVRFWGKASRRSLVWPKGSRALMSPTSDLCPDPGLCQSHSSNLLLLTVPSSCLCSQSAPLQAEAHRSLWASTRELGPADLLETRTGVLRWGTAVGPSSCLFQKELLGDLLPVVR